MTSIRGSCSSRRSVCEVLRALNYSLRTEQAYLCWIRQFIRFHRMRHPREMTEATVSSCLSRPVLAHNVAPNTQARTLNTLVLLNRHALCRPLDEVPGHREGHRGPRGGSRAKGPLLASGR